MPRNLNASTEQAVDRLRGGDDIAIIVHDRDMRCVFELAAAQARRPGLGARHVDAGAALRGIGFGGQLGDGHVDEGRVCRRDGAIGEGDAQSFGEKMDVVGRAEPEHANVVGLQYVQHLHDVNAGRGRRRRPDDFVAAIGPAYRLTLDHVVSGEIRLLDQSAGRGHEGRQRSAEWAVEQCGSARLGDQPQALRIVGLDEPRARLEGGSVGEEEC